MRRRIALAANFFAPLLLAVGCGPTADPQKASPIAKETVDIGDVPKPGAKVPESVVPPKPAAKIPSVKLAVMAFDFTFDPEKGSLIALEPLTGEIREYTRGFLDGTDTNVPPPIPVGASPSALVFKKSGGRRFVAVTLGNGDVAIADLSATPPAVKVVALERVEPGDVIALDDPEDPYLYYSGAKPIAAPDEPPPNIRPFVMFGRIDPRAAKREDLAPAPSLRLRAMSADGQIAYSGGVGAMPAAFSAAELQRPAGDRVMHQLGSASFVGSELVPDTLSQTVAVNDGSQSGAVVFDAAMTKKVGDLPFIPLAYFRARPIVAGMRDGNLKFASTETGKEVAKVPFPRTLVDPQLQPATGRGAAFARPRGFADDFGDRLVVAIGQDAYLIPVPKFSDDGPRAPILALRVRGDRLAIVGKPLTLVLKPQVPGTTLALASGPDGMALAGETLRWTPSEPQVGRAKAKVTLSLKGHTREETIEVEAVLPHVLLDFPCNLLALDPSGHAAVVGETSRTGTRNRVAVIDLDAPKIVASAALPDGLRSLALDGDRAYVGLDVNSVIVALDRKDLKPVRRVFSPFVTSSLWPLAGGRLAASTVMEDNGFNAQAARPLALFTRPDLRPLGEPSKKPARNFDLALNLPIGPAIQPLESGLFLTEGIVAEPVEAGFKTRLLIQPAGFLRMATRDRHGSENPMVLPAPWGRVLRNGSSLATLDSKQVALSSPARPASPHSQVFQGQIVLSMSEPISIQPEVDMDHNFTPRCTKRLIVRDLVLGRTVGVIPIYDRFLGMANSGTLPDGRNSVFRVSGRRVVLLDDFGVFVASLDALDLKAVPQPLHFVPVQSSLSVAPEGATTLTYTLQGGAPPYRLELVDEHPAFRLDPKGATLAIDGPKLADAILKGLSPEISERARGMSKEDFNAMLKEPAVRFEALVGRAPRGVPVLMPIRLKATDEEAQTTFLDHAIFVELPADKVEALRPSK